MSQTYTKYILIFLINLSCTLLLTIFKFGLTTIDSNFLIKLSSILMTASILGWLFEYKDKPNPLTLYLKKLQFYIALIFIIFVISNYLQIPTSLNSALVVYAVTIPSCVVQYAKRSKLIPTKNEFLNWI